MFGGLSRSIKKRGVLGSVKRRFHKLARNVFVRGLHLIEDPNSIRERLSQKFYSEFSGKVQHGSLEGFHIHPDTWWGYTDRAAKLFGLYEKEVVEQLVALSEPRTTFIDIGAADGFFGVGVVSKGYFEKSYCFEISPKGREVIAETATLNGVNDKVVVKGEADLINLANVPEIKDGKAVLLVDIEGAEYELLNNEMVELLAKTPMIIELHDRPDPDGSKREALRARLSTHFDIEVLRQGNRNPFQFPELHDLDDNERWLICAEGRASAMEWLITTPKVPAS